MVLRHAGGDGNTGLDTSEEGRRVYDNLVGPALPLLADMSVLMGGIVGALRIVQRLFAGLQEACDADAESTTLRPAAVGERRVVGCWSGEVPVGVCCIESRAVPGRDVSVVYLDAPRYASRLAAWTHLATMTTSGCRGILGGRVREGVDEWDYTKSMVLF